MSRRSYPATPAAASTEATATSTAAPRGKPATGATFSTPASAGHNPIGEVTLITILVAAPYLWLRYFVLA